MADDKEDLKKKLRAGLAGVDQVAALAQPDVAAPAQPVGPQVAANVPPDVMPGLNKPAGLAPDAGEAKPANAQVAALQQPIGYQNPGMMIGVGGPGQQQAPGFFTPNAQSQPDQIKGMKDLQMSGLIPGYTMSGDPDIRQRQAADYMGQTSKLWNALQEAQQKGGATDIERTRMLGELGIRGGELGQRQQRLDYDTSQERIPEKGLSDFLVKNPNANAKDIRDFMQSFRQAFPQIGVAKGGVNQKVGVQPSDTSITPEDTIESRVPRDIRDMAAKHFADKKTVGDLAASIYNIDNGKYMGQNLQDVLGLMRSHYGQDAVNDFIHRRGVGTLGAERFHSLGWSGGHTQQEAIAAMIRNATGAQQPKTAQEQIGNWLTGLVGAR